MTECRAGQMTQVWARPTKSPGTRTSGFMSPSPLRSPRSSLRHMRFSRVPHSPMRTTVPRATSLSTKSTTSPSPKRRAGACSAMNCRAEDRRLGNRPRSSPPRAALWTTGHRNRLEAVPRPIRTCGAGRCVGASPPIRSYAVSSGLTALHVAADVFDTPDERADANLALLLDRFARVVDRQGTGTNDGQRPGPRHGLNETSASSHQLRTLLPRNCT
jgi:hypothetical protein